MSVIVNDSPQEKKLYWLTDATWSQTVYLSYQHVQHMVVEAFGTPEEPARAGRHAVDRHAEDLRRLADS